MDLLERERQLGALDGWLREAAAGQGRLALVAGEAGVGKTALVGRLREAARGRARVLVGACDALSPPPPLGPLRDIAAAAGAGLDRLLAENAPRDRIFRAALAELGAGLAPTLAVVEDAHWADEATLDLLRFLGRRLGGVRALLVVTYRDDEVGPQHPLRVVLGDLATSATCRRLPLSPLSESAVRTLAAGSAVDPAGLYRLTGGNPFYVTEVLASGPAGLSPTVRDAVLTRAARLTPVGRAALETAAAIGSTAEPWLLAAVLGPGVDAVDECLAAGLLRADGAALVFRHELARAVILDAVSPVRAAALHRAVLAALRARGALPDDLARLAHHAEMAADRAAVLEYAPASARRAAGLGAHRESAAQYARALRFATDLPGERREPLLAARLVELHLTGQMADAIAAGEALLAIARRAGDVPLEAERLAWLAWLLVAAGRNAEADQASGAALDVLAGVPPGRAHAFAFSVHASLRMLNRDCADAIAWGERAIALAERFDDVEVRVRAINTVGAARLVAGDLEPGRAALEQSLHLAREAGLESDVAAAFSNLGSAYGEIYQFALAEHYLTEGIAYAAERDLDRWHWYMVAWLALTRFFQGRWTEAASLAGSVIRHPGATVISRIMALVALGRVRARRGDPEVAPILDDALALAAPTQTLQRLAPVRAARAEAAWLAGDQDRAREEARAAYDLAARHGLRWHVGELAYWRWRARDLDTQPLDTADPFAFQIGGDWAAAAAAWSELGCPYEAARALAEGDEAAIREALAEFDRLGARPAAAMAARRLRELGARVIPRGPRPATRANPANLTPREAEVLALIAARSTNAEVAARLFLSPKTVEHHVSAVLAKLDVASRAEAAEAAVRRGLLPQDGGAPTPT